MLKKAALALIVFGSLLGLYASAEERVDLVFTDFRFQAPANPASIGVQDSEAFLAVRYGTQAGHNYLTFTDQPDVPTNGCPPEEFFSRAFETEAKTVVGTLCATSDVEDFRTAFISTSRSGVWKGRGFQAYYLLQDKKSMVYLVGSDSSYVKIDTDFMSKNELESLVREAELL